MESCVKIPHKCKEREIEVEGKCKLCALYEYATPDKKTCKTPKCSWRQKILMTGKCEDCPPHTSSKMKDGQKKCEKEECEDDEMLSKLGVCVKCRQYTRPVLPDAMSCEMPDCKYRDQKVNKKGECIIC